MLGGVAALAQSGAVNEPAVATRTAERIVRPVGDIAVAFDVGEIDQFVVNGVHTAVAEVGGLAAPGRSGSVGMWRVARGGATVHAPPSGYLIPIVFVALPRQAVGGVLGTEVSAALSADTVVLNEITADLMGARQGDVLDVRAVDGSTVSLTIADIGTAEALGWAELAFTTDVADRLGFTADTRMVMWDFDDRAGLDAALAAAGVLGRSNTLVSRSWDPPNPDSTLSTIDTKLALGEPWYRVNADDSLSMHPTWKATNLTDGPVLLNDIVRVEARCHVKVVDDLKRAFAEVAAAGLGGAIEVNNANTYGGCFNARYSRSSGFLSRHAYAMAFDTNTQSNCVGCRPVMNCDVVRIFRKHGFAWGGNFRQPDGMHFEWVGEPRHQIAFPSTYCSNIVNPTVESLASPSIGRGVLVAGGDAIDHEHSDVP